MCLHPRWFPSVPDRRPRPDRPSVWPGWLRTTHPVVMPPNCKVLPDRFFNLDTKKLRQRSRCWIRRLPTVLGLSAAMPVNPNLNRRIFAPGVSRGPIICLRFWRGGVVDGRPLYATKSYRDRPLLQSPPPQSLPRHVAGRRCRRRYGIFVRRATLADTLP